MADEKILLSALDKLRFGQDRGQWSTDFSSAQCRALLEKIESNNNPNEGDETNMSTTGTEKKATAVKAIITALSPIIPQIADHPEIAADVSKLVDDIVAIKNMGKGPRQPLNRTQLLIALITVATAISDVEEQSKADQKKGLPGPPPPTNKPQSH